MVGATFIPILRGEVTEAVVTLLPGAASPSALPWLLAAVQAQLRACPDMIRMLEPGLSEEHAVGGAPRTAQLLYPVWYELRGRAPRSAAVEPSARLRGRRERTEREVDGLLGGYFRRGGHPAMLRAARARLMRGLVEIGDEAAAARPASGGWLLLAALSVIRDHPVMPRPGAAATAAVEPFGGLGRRDRPPDRRGAGGGHRAEPAGAGRRVTGPG